MFKESIMTLHGFTHFPNQDLIEIIISDNSKLILQCVIRLLFLGSIRAELMKHKLMCL